jgi:DNA polymerase-3 subunit gamma/tau
MENFIVSARKYRPITFDQVVGQKSITSTLKNAIRNNHIAQAFLFTGPRGVGKTTCARVFAKTINCMNPTENMEPCNECESCTSFNQSHSFNISELDAASNNSVEDIRKLVDQVRIPPQVGAYKVYIIDEVHMLSSAAFNAFLKTLEEPPAYAKFILATTEKHKILPTILSRCQIYDFNRITMADIIDHLKFVAQQEGVQYEEEALHIVAQKADGALRDALSIFDQLVSYSGQHITYKGTIENLNVLDLEYYFTMVSYFLNKDISSSLNTYNEIIAKGFDGHHFINGLASHIRDLMVSKDQLTIDLLETSENIKERYREQSQYCDLAFLIRSLEICSKVDLSYKSASDKRLLVELSLVQMCELAGAETSGKVAQAPPVAQATPAPPKPTPPPPAPPKPAASTPPPTPQKSAPVATPTTAASTQTPTQSANKPQESAGGLRRRRGGSGALSINQVMANAGVKKEEEKIDIAAELAGNWDTVEREITREEMDAAFEKYRNLIQRDKPGYAVALKPDNIELQANNKIILTVYNENFQDPNFLYHLLKEIKKNLGNNQITIETKLERIEVERSKTSFEEFHEMAKENPNLQKLKDDLELEFE